MSEALPQGEPKSVIPAAATTVLCHYNAKSTESSLWLFKALHRFVCDECRSLNGLEGLQDRLWENPLKDQTKGFKSFVQRLIVFNAP